jgi:hypothetical protein
MRLQCILALIMHISLLTGSEAADQECDFDVWSKEHLVPIENRYFYNQIAFLVQFDNLTKLSKIPCVTKKINVDYFGIHSLSRETFQTNFDLTQLIELFDFEEGSPKTVYFLNFNGFNIEKQHLYENRILKDYDIQIKYSDFGFYYKSQLITKALCKKTNFNESYFGSIRRLFFIDDVIYSLNVCPFVFAHTKIKHLALAEITNSLIFKNRLSFMSLNDTSLYEMNTIEIFQLTLIVAYEEIDHALINTHVFKHIWLLFVSGIIYKIDSDLFREFNFIRTIVLNPAELSKFYQNDNLAWTASLNFKLENINLSDKRKVSMYKARSIILQIFETKSYFAQGYAYPNEDFCVFKNFPHEKLVYPAIMSTDEEIQCSCTVFWLIQHSEIYFYANFSFYDENFFGSYPDEFASISARNCLKKFDLRNEIKKCNFRDRLEKCNLTSANQKKFKFPLRGNINTFFIFEWLQYIIQVYIQTIFCLVGIFTNTLTYLVVRRKTKPLNKPMYHHIGFNSVFHFFICLLTLVSLINVCIFPKTSFCSSIMKSHLSQYFKIYMIHFFVNCLRLLANFSYFCFSVSRFFLSTSPMNRFSKKFETLNLKKLYFILFILCAIVSLFKVFEYKVNKSFGLTNKKYPFNSYEISFCVYNSYFSQRHSFECKFFQIMNVIANTLNNIVFFLLNIVVDLLLLGYLKYLIKKKGEHFQANENEANLKRAKKAKKKFTKFLLFDGLLYLLTHVFAFSVTIWLLAYKKQLSEFCYGYFSCPDIVDMAQTLEIFFICSQFFVLKKFDCNFSFEFNVLVKRIFPKKK